MPNATKTDKSLEEYNQASLFDFQTNSKDPYSHTIELYDAIPKYVWDGNRNRIEGSFLNSIERDFVHKGTKYNVTISPARVKDSDGVYRDYFPSQREELVEDALRKLASDGKGVYLDNLAGVVFTLYELRQELRRMGHGYNLVDVKRSLMICAKTGLDIRTNDGNVILTSNMFETLGLHSREENTKCFVRFSCLVTESIKNRNFRQINYDKYMGYKRVISRWLHKRMAHTYKQANYLNPYTISLSTVVRDSGISVSRLRKALQKVQESLDELVEAGTIAEYSTEKIMDQDRANRMIDAKFIVYPAQTFVQDAIRANKLSRGNSAIKFKN